MDVGHRTLSFFIGWMDGWMEKISDETFIKSLLVTSWQGVVAEHLAKFFLGLKT